MKKRIFTGLLLVVFSLSISIPAAAVEMTTTAEADGPVASGQLVISDPSTGEQWNWDLDSSTILTENVEGTARAAYASNQIGYAEIEVDIGEYLIQTMSKPVDIETVLRDDVTITVGLNYSADASNNTVSIYRAYGSTPDNGFYYVVDKEFYYANPAVFGPIKKTPTTTSWSYSTDSTAGSYYGDVAPYALLDCKITVRGMESSCREVSVSCELTFT